MLKSIQIKMERDGAIMKKQNQVTPFGPSEEETQAYKNLVNLFRQCPIPDDEILKDMLLFLTRSSLGHILFIDSLYRQILNLPGCIMEFGVRWGRNLSLFTSLRSLYEPYNMSRKIIGFDTFEGFPSVSKQDGKHDLIAEGSMSVTEDYEVYLKNLLLQQQHLGPRSHIERFELVKGDAAITLAAYLDTHPETVCALAYFDFDIYDPTKKCLDLIQQVITKGSILVFDQFTLEVFQGETIAVKEVLGLENHRFHKDPRVPYAAYVIIE